MVSEIKAHRHSLGGVVEPRERGHRSVGGWSPPGKDPEAAEVPRVQQSGNRRASRHVVRRVRVELATKVGQLLTQADVQLVCLDRDFELREFPEEFAPLMK